MEEFKFDLERLKPYPELYEAAKAMADYYSQGKFSEEWTEESIKEYTELVENIYRGMMFFPDGKEEGGEFLLYLKKELLPEPFVKYLNVLSDVGIRFVGSIVVPLLIYSLNDITIANLIRDLSDIEDELGRLKSFNSMIAKPKAEGQIAEILNNLQGQTALQVLRSVVDTDSRCNWEYSEEENRFYLSEEDKKRLLWRLNRDIKIKGECVAKSLAFEKKLGEVREEYNYLKKWLPKGYSVVSKAWDKRDKEIVEMFTRSSDIIKEVCSEEIEVPTFAKFKKNGIPEEYKKEWELYLEFFKNFFNGIFKEVVVPIR